MSEEPADDLVRELRADVKALTRTVDALAAAVKHLTEAIPAMVLREVYDADQRHTGDRLTSVESTLTWVARTVLGAVILAALGLVLTVGR